MATLTAQLLIGKGHPYHGGINPTHYLFLSENSVPAWILVPENLFSSKQLKPFKKKVWIPTLEHMLEDGLLMAAYYVLNDPVIQEKASPFVEAKEGRSFQLYKDIGMNSLRELHALCRQIDTDYKVAFTIFDDSSLNSHLDVLKQYKMDVEICLSCYHRYWNVWTNRTEERGNWPTR
ncbi:hypothetical protein [Geobacillus sp. BK01]|uniref:hypothetical protein n=1 Tax=Geobacillus sp. BK01 TaxID=3457328 RepID=UPI003FA53299